MDPLITQLRKNHHIIHCLKLTARPLKIDGNGRRLGSFPFGAISAYFAKENLLLVWVDGSEILQASGAVYPIFTGVLYGCINICIYIYIYIPKGKEVDLGTPKTQPIWDPKIPTKLQRGGSRDTLSRDSWVPPATRKTPTLENENDGCAGCVFYLLVMAKKGKDKKGKGKELPKNGAESTRKIILDSTTWGEVAC